mgnify:CR=1 FL=1
MNRRIRAAAPGPVTMALAALAVVVFTCDAAAAPLPISSEFDVASIRVPVQYAQEAPAIARYADGYLVVWQDKRNKTDYDIYGMFLDVNGNPVSGESFLISKVGNGFGAPNDQLLPAVSYNGTNFLVVWTDYRESLQFAHIYGTRVTTTGQLLDGDGMAISGTGTSSYESAPAIATTGTYWEVVWERNGVDIYGVRITSTGSIGTKTALAARADNEVAPSIYWNGTYYLLVWEDYRNAESTGIDIYGCLVTSAGTKSGSDKLISTAPGSSSAGAAGTQNAPYVSAAGGSWFVAWEDSRNGNKDIYATRVSSSATPQDLGGIPVSTAALDQQTPVIGWDGSHFLTVWRDTNASRKIRGARVTTAGSVVDPGGFDISTISAGRIGPAIASRTGSSVVCWYNLGTTETDIIGCRVASGVAGPEVVMSLSAQDQSPSAVAFDGTNYVAVWADRRGGYYAIYAARIDKDGNVIDAEGVPVTAPPAANQTEPAIAWNGSNFLIVWTEGTETTRDIKGRRFDSSLAPIDAAPLTICDAELDQRSPTVAANGAEYLVAWVDSRSAVAPDYYTDIFAARVTAAGTALPTSSICTYTNNQFAPSVTAGGGKWLIAWEDYRSGSSEVYYLRVNADGTVPAGETNGKKLSTAVANKYTPRLAFDGTNYLIIWADNRNWGMDIFGCRISTAGARVDANDIAITTNSSQQADPAVAWDTENYVIAWDDYRTGMTQGYDVYCARMSPAGTVLDPDGFAVSTGPWYESKPALAAAGPAWFGVFYTKSICYIDRLAGRIVGESPPLVLGTVHEVKSQPDGTRIRINDKTVTAGTDQLTTCFYVEESDRTSGIRVSSTEPVYEGQVVDVTGTVQTIDGERQLVDPVIFIEPQPGTVPQPLAMMSRALGGAALNAYTPAVEHGNGSHNIGLLVRSWGWVRSVGPDYFVFDDGGTLFDSQGTQVRVSALAKLPAGLSVPEVGTLVTVTGISSCEPVGGNLMRKILVRKASDLETHP